MAGIYVFPYCNPCTLVILLSSLDTVLTHAHVWTDISLGYVAGQGH